MTGTQSPLETVAETPPADPTRSSHRSPARAVLMGGLIAGTIDIGAACVLNRVGPETILRAIASGVLGSESFHLGVGAATLGLLLQWFMSLIIAGLYVGACVVLPELRRHWVAAGCAYGIPIFAVMNYIVLPLSAVGHMPHFTMATAAANLAAMMVFGLVVSYFASDRPRGAAESRK